MVLGGLGVRGFPRNLDKFKKDNSSSHRKTVRVQKESMLPYWEDRKASARTCVLASSNGYVSRCTAVVAGSHSGPRYTFNTKSLTLKPKP